MYHSSHSWITYQSIRHNNNNKHTTINNCAALLLLLCLLLSLHHYTSKRNEIPERGALLVSHHLSPCTILHNYLLTSECPLDWICPRCFTSFPVPCSNPALTPLPRAHLNIPLFPPSPCLYHCPLSQKLVIGEWLPPLSLSLRRPDSHVTFIHIHHLLCTFWPILSTPLHSPPPLSSNPSSNPLPRFALS